MEVLGKGAYTPEQAGGTPGHRASIREFTRGFSNDREPQEQGDGLRRGRAESCCWAHTQSTSPIKTKSHKTSLRKNVFKDSDTKGQAATQYNGMG